MLPRELGPIYRLGRVVMSPNARVRVSDHDLAAALLGHLQKVCGNRQRWRNTRRTSQPLTGCRLLSACCTSDGTRFWIISESDKSRTTVLLPGDYGLFSGNGTTRFST